MPNGLNIIEHPVPNYTKGHVRPVKFGIIHFVSARYYEGYQDDPYNIEGILKLFDERGPIDQFSCHYIIARDGAVYRLVHIEDTSWNAGKSVIAIPEYMTSLNASSIGVELVGMEGDRYANPQYQTLAKLAVLIEDEVSNLGVGQLDHWVGHDWVSGEIAVKLGIKNKSVMKKDPGVLFDWLIFLREKHRVRLETEVKTNCRQEMRDETLASLTSHECFSLWMSKLMGRKK